MRLASLLLLLAACGDEPRVAAPERVGRPVVYTTFYPTTYFTERIVGDLATVVCPLPDGADPIFWQPTDADVAGYQEADLIIVNGAQFEKWLANVTLPEDRIVDTAKSFEAASELAASAKGTGGTLQRRRGGALRR